MIVNADTVALAFKGFQTKFSDAFAATEVDWPKVAMEVPSQAADETYGWLGRFPNMREWIGGRVIKNLAAHGFTIKNKTFESTISVARTDFEDDRLGIFGPVQSEMGGIAKHRPESIIFGLLKTGFTTVGFDTANFFDTVHPVIGEDGTTVTNVANTDGGAGTPWFLLDTTRAIRPMIWQSRTGYEFQAKTQNYDDNVFLNDEYLYGVRARANAGFGLWQLAWGSKQALNAANYAAARAAMAGFKADGGKILVVKPNLLVVPPALEQAARDLVKAPTGAAGASNSWYQSADLVVTPYLI